MVSLLLDRVQPVTSPPPPPKKKKKKKGGRRRRKKGEYKTFVNYSALLWQKEASDIPSKSELLMFSYKILPSVFFFQAKFYA